MCRLPPKDILCVIHVSAMSCQRLSTHCQTDTAASASPPKLASHCPVPGEARAPPLAEGSPAGSSHWSAENCWPEVRANPEEAERPSKTRSRLTPAWTDFDRKRGKKENLMVVQGCVFCSFWCLFLELGFFSAAISHKIERCTALINGCRSWGSSHCTPVLRNLLRFVTFPICCR